jgi:hypothetical protein
MVIWRNVLKLGSIVVSHNCSAFISPDLYIVEWMRAHSFIGLISLRIIPYSSYSFLTKYKGGAAIYT